MALALLAALTACRDSAKSSAPSPVPSPALSVQAQQPASVTPKSTPPHAVTLPVPTHEPPPPPMDTMVPVKTFQVQLPAAFTADQLAQDEAVEFQFQGSAGQMLRVRGGQPRVRIQPPGGGPALLPGWDSAGNWLYGLPETGAYRVLYAPWKTTPRIQFDFLPDDDPKVDPGVKPEEVSVDFGALAPGQALTIAPFAIDEESELFWESWPTHLAVVRRGFEFRIMTVAGNKAVFKKYERMTALESALQAQGKKTNVEELPYPIHGDAGLNFATRPLFMQGEGWRGLRWIASYGQDIGCWFDDSAYVFEGISNDGRFFVLMRATLSNPKVMAKLAQDCLDAENKSVHYQQRDDTFVKEASAMFDKELSSADPASFQPSLDQLDAVIRSLKLKP